MSEHTRLTSQLLNETSKFIRNPAIRDDVYQTLQSELGGETAAKRLDNVMKKCESDHMKNDNLFQVVANELINVVQFLYRKPTMLQERLKLKELLRGMNFMLGAF